MEAAAAAVSALSAWHAKVRVEEADSDYTSTPIGRSKFWIFNCYKGGGQKGKAWFCLQPGYARKSLVSLPYLYLLISDKEGKK